jgi:hypothetical protein
MWSLAIAAAGAAPAACETLGAVGASVAEVVGAAAAGAAAAGAAVTGAVSTGAVSTGAVMTVGAADCSAAGGSASERGTALTLKHPSTPNIERMTLLAGTNKTMTQTSPGPPGLFASVVFGTLSCLRGIPYHGRGLAREKCTTRRRKQHSNSTVAAMWTTRARMVVVDALELGEGVPSAATVGLSRRCPSPIT